MRWLDALPSGLTGVLLAVVCLAGEVTAQSAPKNGRNKAASKLTKLIHADIELLGKGACRGAGWQDGIWPLDLGRRTTKDCAGICKDTKGCVAFDLSNKEGEKYDCLLMGHPNIYPATAMKAECYLLVGAKVDPETRKSAPPKAPASAKKSGGKDPRWEDPATRPTPVPEIKKANQGASKTSSSDPRWQDPTIRAPPVGDTKKTNAAPSKQGAKDSRWEDPATREPAAGETKKSASKPMAQGMKDQRWEDPATREPAAGESKTTKATATKQGTKDPRWEDPATRAPAAGDVKQPSAKSAKQGVKDARWEDPATRAPAAGDVKKTGKTTAKQGVKDSRWEDPATREPAAGESKKSSPAAKQGSKDQRWEDPSTREPAAGESKKASPAARQGAKDTRWEDPSTRDPAPGEVKKTSTAAKHGAKDARWEDPATRIPAAGERAKGGPPAPSRKTNDVYPAGGAGYARLGSGRCRGQGWQEGKWPVDGGSKTAMECTDVCKKTGGCRAFDLSFGEDKKFTCTLYGHQSIVPTGGSGSMSGACYSISDSLAEDVDEVEEDAGEEEDMIIDLAGDIDMALLGKGGCRGGGWQDKDWPKLRGFLSLDSCGRECVRAEGCTAFHAAAAKEGSTDLFECFLFGHKSVIAAKGLVGNCYTVSKGTAKTIRSKALPGAQKKKKAYKIPEFEQPKVIEDEYEEDDDEWLFEPPPPEVRSRDHINQILALDEPAHDGVLKVTETTLKELKKVYENSIKDLEKSYMYKELSHRHFGDPEMFNKPLIVLMGPWSGGKSTIINYLLGNEYNENAFKTSAEPSSGFNFNIAMYGEEAEEVEGTELAAEWAFSSLQKFGQEFLKKLRGKKMPNKLLEKWFIDHADLIVLVYDYAKLDIGPETEALLDQLKGRESQVRIILNKADEITAEELLKIQGNLVWNVSPLMASMEPPTLYAGSFWSRPYKVRVRNHAKMVDCYLTTYLNNKGMFGDKKKVAQDIIDNPSKYHIYEGLSTLTNISRYDLPDPDTYRDFFNVHPLYDFPSLQSTCTFFKGCPLNKLDISIAYELPEILTSYKRKVKLALNPPKVEVPPPKKNIKK